MRTIVGVTGASGTAFAIEFLKRCPGEKILVMTRWAKSVLHQETGLAFSDLHKLADRVYAGDDLNAPVASGSNVFDQFVVIPCSVTTLGRLAGGIGDNLVSRVGEVALKEGRRTVLCLRETPLSAIALENALKLSRLGVTIMPISPPFYMGAQTVDQLAGHFVDHLLGTLALPTRPGWRGAELPAS